MGWNTRIPYYTRSNNYQELITPEERIADKLMWMRVLVGLTVWILHSTTFMCIYSLATLNQSYRIRGLHGVYML